MMSSKKKLPNAYHFPEHATAKLDLHGCSRSEGICETTQFLDRIRSRRERTKNISNEAWVLIVTGSGSHSAHGPILRSAIENLLIKRRIEYYQMEGRGSFLVNALSGFVLYEPEQPKDSKVIVAPIVPRCDFYDHEVGAVPSRTTIKSMSLTQQIIPAETVGKSMDNNKSLKKSFNQQQNEQNAYQKAISDSLAEIQQVEKEDEGLLERAFNLSILDKNKEMEEEQKLEQAMEDSRHEALTEQQQQESNSIDNEMMSAIEQSILDHQQYKESDEELMLKVLEQSVVEF